MLDFLKKKKWLIICLTILIIFLVTVIVLLCNTVFKSEYEELSDKLEKKNKEYTAIKTKYDKSENDNKEKETKINELSQEEKQNEINNNIKSLEKKVEELTDTKNSLETEVAKLKEDVIKTKGQAKSYPAGYLTAGTDFETGRYKIYGGSSNFVVHSAGGSLRVNIILGSYGIDEYVYTFSVGDKVEARSSFKMIPIE